MENNHSKNFSLFIAILYFLGFDILKPFIFQTRKKANKQRSCYLPSYIFVNSCLKPYLPTNQGRIFDDK